MSFELRPTDSPAVDPNHIQIVWGAPGTPGSGIKSSVDAWLTEIGAVSDRAIDFTRLAGAAYVADRLSPRGQGYSRTIDLHVQLCDSPRWLKLLTDVEHLLGWISGDEWHLSVSQESAGRPNASAAIALADDAETVGLLSGGLDSFSGALLRTAPTVFVSHSDNPTVASAQARTWKWLQEHGLSGGRVRITFSEAARKRESTTRTRALLFYAFAVAVATAHGIGLVEVPENGFTSLNLSFGNDRGGVLSTRSTHPWTMHLLRSLMRSTGLNVEVKNPYETLTKGELVVAAANRCANFADGASRTLSCAKLNGRTYKGGNQNLNCGLCVACLTRRASLTAAGGDTTPYLATALAGASLTRLWADRGRDVRAVASRIYVPVDEFSLLQNGPYPDDFDLTIAADMCRRGFAELAEVLRGVAP